MSEILGIASTSALTSQKAAAKLEEHETHKLNVSSTSVADYFKEKMRLVAAGKSVVKAADDGDLEVRGGIGAMRRAVEDDEEDAGEQRVGLGMKFGSGMMARMGLGAPLDTMDEKVVVKEESKRKDNDGNEEANEDVQLEDSQKKKKGKRKDGEEKKKRKHSD